MPSRLARQTSLPLCLISLLIVGCGDKSTDVQTGSIRVQLKISGSMPDTDGCSITVKDSDSRVLSSGESHVFESLPTGTHTVAISDVALNCMVEGEVSRSVYVSADATARTFFDLHCPAPGSLRIATSSLGSEPDPDGYEVVLNDVVIGDIGVSDTLVVDGLVAGEYDVVLTSVADHCVVDGEHPRAVTVWEGQVAHIRMLVACGACFPDLPDPVIRFAGRGECQPDLDGCHYWFATLNASEYPDLLFALTTDYGPCGRNPDPSRTWLEIYESPRGNRRYGYCALGSADGLSAWAVFLSPEDPPDIYMQLHDRACDISYTSNTVDIP